MKGTLEDMCVLCLPINVSSRYGRQSIEETETSELIGIPDINYCPVQKHGWRNYKGIIRKVVDKKQARPDQVKITCILLLYLKELGALVQWIEIDFGVEKWSANHSVGRVPGYP